MSFLHYLGDNNEFFYAISEITMIFLHYLRDNNEFPMLSGRITMSFYLGEVCDNSTKLSVVYD